MSPYISAEGANNRLKETKNRPLSPFRSGCYMPYRPDFTILFPETCKIIGLSATKQQKRPKAGLFCLSKYLSKLSRIIFSGQASDSTIHTDQGKQPDREKHKLPFKIIRKKNKKKSEKKQTDDEPQERQEVYIL